jgi:glycosidase
MKKIVLLFTVILMIFTGCFNDSKKEEKGVGVTLERRDNEVVVIAKEELKGVELEIKGIISNELIKYEVDKMVMSKSVNENTQVLIAKLDGVINKGEEIIKIKSSEPIQVTLKEGYSDGKFIKRNAEELEKILKKGVRATQEELLGDFNSDEKVDIVDFENFRKNYAGKDMLYDIAPAKYGTTVNRTDIYTTKHADGLVNILDFIVFANNYGKSFNIKTVESISIVGAVTLEAGTEGSYISKVVYNNGTIEDAVTANWSSSNEAVATITVSGGSAVVKAISAGTTDIKVEKDGKVYTLKITVEEKIEESLKIYIEATAATTQLYAWVVDGTTTTRLNGAWPGTKLTKLDGKFYCLDLGTTYKKVNYIHFIGGQSKDHSTDKSVWIMANGTIKTLNPYEATKPIINITPNKAVMNPEQKIKIELTVANNTIDTMSATFNGKPITVKEGITEVTVKDYLSNGKTGVLTVTATNNLGTTTKSMNITADESVSYGMKLYIEKNQTLYAWSTASGAVEALNGAWPGKTLTATETMSGKTWYVFDFQDKESAMYILGGGGDTAITQTTWIKADGSKSVVDPYLPTKPEVSISPGSGTVNDTKGTRTITIKVTANNATVDSKTATIGGATVALTGETTTLKLGDYIKNGETKIIKVTGINTLGTTTKDVTIKRDDSYTVPTGEFTWDNATVYFVLTDRFYNGNPENDNSYGRKNGFKPDPLDVATFHGGDVAGLTKKIEEGYFTELGVNVIWYTATYEQIHGWVGGGSGDFPHYAYHGYYALDWTMMDRNMGTVDEMRKFVDTAHENNIRVVMDVVVNHAGYNSAMDMHDFGFASYDKAVIKDRDWMHPMVASGWQSHHDKSVFYTKETAATSATATPITDWLKWWGADWVRTGIDGYSAGDGTELQNPLSGLPDFKTESTTPVDLAPILKTKWTFEAKEGDDEYDKITGGNYDKYIIPACKSIRNITAKTTPADYVIKSLAAWVEEFGIDGFRCDTAKHIELSRWKQLQAESNIALKKWRAANPNNPASKWKDDFWMVGEHWDFKNGMDKGYFDNGFKTMVDFGFPHKNGGTGAAMIGTWAGYAATPNVAMPYINSHDMGKVGFFGKGASCIPAGTALLLTPSPVQIYYGDENDRPLGPKCSDPDHPTRSDYVWGANPDKLAHWQKVGRFRNINPAVGAGTQIALMKQTNAVKRVYKENIVVIVVDASGSTTVDVSEVTEWPEGTKLRNGYNGEESTVTGGKVTFTGENGIILIEDATKVKR